MRTKKAIANIITSLLVQILNVIWGFIVPRLIISNYGSNVNGLISSITRFLAYITLLEAGFGPVIKSVLYKPLANKDKNEIEKILKASEKIFRKISYIFIVYIAVLCIILPLVVNNEFNSLFTISLIIIIAISTFSEYYFGMTYSLFLQAEQKKYVASIIQIGIYIVNIILTVSLIHFKCSIQVVKLSSTLIFVLRPVLQNIYVKKKYNIHLKNADSSYQLKQKWDGLVQHIAYVIHKNIDVILLTLCTNLKEISVYSVYLIIIEGVERIVQSFSGGVDATFGNMIAKGEKENLNKKFNLFEGLYLTVATIIFCSTLILIVPFVRIYTNAITDANYIRPIFAYLIVISEFSYIVMLLYYDLVKVAGHFKQTKKGAYIEATLNLLISLALVWKYGLIGVAIGTLVATIVRMLEIIYYTSKNILSRNVWYSFKRIIGIIFEFLIVIFFVRLINLPQVDSYGKWMIQAIIVTFISSVVVVLFNRLVYKDSIKNIIKIIKRKNA